MQYINLEWSKAGRMKRDTRTEYGEVKLKKINKLDEMIKGRVGMIIAGRSVEYTICEALYVQKLFLAI